MSFKRDGDDLALLNNLKMRRVSELLGENIPDTEAKLLSNGRLTCLICTHRPIFDSISVLANHRKGRKHIEELGKYLLHKRELEFKKLQFDHKEYLKIEAVKGTNSKFKCKAGANALSRIDTPAVKLSLPRDVPCSIPSTTSVVRHYLKGIQRQRALQKTVERCRESYLAATTTATISTTTTQTVTEQKTKIPQEKHSDCHYEGKTDNSSRDVQLRMSGWIKSSDGQWMKDPEVEFDSDEEAPDN